MERTVVPKKNKFEEPMNSDTKKERISPPDPNEGKIHYKKIGGGTFRMANGRIIKPNQRFWALPEQIPDGAKHVVIPVNPEEEPPRITPVETTYSIETGAPGWYNVVDSNGKRMNEKQLRQ